MGVRFICLFAVYLKEAGLGVMFHAKTRVATEATARIDHSDLSALLFVQGYAEGEFVRNKSA